MTKFPDGDDIEKDKDLENVISCTEKHVKECGYAPRIAKASSRYHDSLWDNVELHLLGCSRGIAIVEDRSKGEFNPNVAMEWGFMRALGKPVLYLEERGFKYRRADWSGLLKDQFEWENPEDGIRKAVANWLGR